jgi:hypothetical protein
MRTRLAALLAMLSAILLGEGYYLPPRVQTVYIASLTNPLDQHIVSRLTNDRILWIVLDPASADTVLTDTLDENFQNWIERTYPLPQGRAEAFQRHDPRRCHGTVFLVDPHSRVVLRSVCDPPKNPLRSEQGAAGPPIAFQLKSVITKK